MIEQHVAEDAVSPVIGVMLMLVVTIIIAAVVSAFSGGMMKSEQTAPQASFECVISNDGTWGGSSFSLTCLAASEGIPTKDLKLVTNWKASDGTTGGATITGPSTEPNTHYKNATGTPENTYHSPLGFGPGVRDWVASGNYNLSQHFGNYTIMAGTAMHNSAYGWNEAYGGYGVTPGSRYQYTEGSAFSLANQDVDGITAILGKDWYHLQPGDVVTVKLAHIPSGKVIFEKNVVVEG
ncbi:type IV pilin N-terminal domain-containing protein [Methanoculleus sp. 7T]|uniref:type IV pilin N-terminal domain-containing protein n=1 Tax=Methanoculleus sp. 7T TaxID=2937282 RepID=UPI0020BFC52F|nr:type IV pilin N-terminal domain-containing protein [Methanoculleus sp. 7T]MCK8517820.1 type IV pilin N-terminal domain-containing protein [Methanoculleus sp. 7T]